MALRARDSWFFYRLKSASRGSLLRQVIEFPRVKDEVCRLCAAGARWIQLRMKGATRAAWLAEAAAAAAACRRHGAVLVVNDSVEIALESGADGAHLGGLDADWREARQRLGPGRILGGTVGSRGGALRAGRSGEIGRAW